MAIIGQYKYGIAMSPVSKPIEEIKKNFVIDKFQEVITGKTELLISPLYYDDSKNIWYYQPILDIDLSSISLTSSLILIKRILYNIKSSTRDYPIVNLNNTVVEWSGNGFHVVMNVAFSIELDDLKILRKECMRLQPEIDCVASFRDIPMRRLGGVKNGNVFVPIAPKEFFTGKLKPKPIKNHLFYMPEDKWKYALTEFLIPKRFVDMEKGQTIQLIKNLINA